MAVAMTEVPGRRSSPLVVGVRLEVVAAAAAEASGPSPGVVAAEAAAASDPLREVTVATGAVSSCDAASSRPPVAEGAGPVPMRPSCGA